MVMDGEQRRATILSQLAQAKKPISASKFAEAFGVSRQVVVGDIALLRAMGEEIVATARGYQKERSRGLLERKIAVQHTAEQTREELQTIVTLGGEVVDVMVAHEIYGEIHGNLHVRTPEDIEKFMQSYEQSNNNLLSELTNGVHIHTIRYPDEATFKAIEQGLIAKGFLYQD